MVFAIVGAVDRTLLNGQIPDESGHRALTVMNVIHGYDERARDHVQGAEITAAVELRGFPPQPAPSLAPPSHPLHHR